jgi:hypothetical protein
LTFEWDFGDGSLEGTSDSTTPKYTYKEDGEYTVTLKVSDEYKGSDTKTITITATDLGPNAKITGQTTGEEDVNLQFSAEQSTSSPDRIKKYEWDWDGDGIYDEETTTATASHAWDKSDAYTLTLRITDTDSSTSTDTLNVIITEKPSSGGSGGDSSKTAADNTSILIAIAVVIVAVILVAMFILMRRKKPTETQPSDERVAANVNAQSSRRPTTQFADASIKPAMAPPGTTPPQQMTTPVQQVSALPPSKLPEKPSQQEQRDWNWNFNE